MIVITDIIYYVQNGGDNIIYYYYVKILYLHVTMTLCIGKKWSTQQKRYINLSLLLIIIININIFNDLNETPDIKNWF